MLTPDIVTRDILVGPVQHCTRTCCVEFGVKAFGTALLIAPSWHVYPLACCCGFDLCHKSILSPGQGWYRSAKAQNSTKAPLTGNPNQLGPHMLRDQYILHLFLYFRCKKVRRLQMMYICAVVMQCRTSFECRL
jgi:hypothetical protein